MDGADAHHEPQQEVDATGLILRRIAKAPHPLTVADVRKADDGGMTLDPQETLAKLEEFCGTGLVQSEYHPYPKCILTKGNCPPQMVYTITAAGKKLLGEN